MRVERMALLTRFLSIAALALVAVALFGNAGCSALHPDWEGVVRLQPVRVTADGANPWTREAFGAQVAAANIYYECTGIQFKSLSLIDLENPDLASVEGLAEYGQVIAALDSIADVTGAYPVALVDTIEWEAGSAGGMSCMPWFPEGLSNGALVSWINQKALQTLAHELGHSWGLLDRDVGAPCPEPVCLLMSYCFRPASCTAGPFFSPSEIANIRYWSARPERSFCIETVSGELKPKDRVERWPTSTQPCVDYVR